MVLFFFLDNTKQWYKKSFHGEVITVFSATTFPICYSIASEIFFLSIAFFCATIISIVSEIIIVPLIIDSLLVIKYTVPKTIFRLKKYLDFICFVSKKTLNLTARKFKTKSDDGNLIKIRTGGHIYELYTHPTLLTPF